MTKCQLLIFKPSNLSLRRADAHQMCVWGHPSTTGLPHMDYFLTSDTFHGSAQRLAMLALKGSGFSEQVWCIHVYRVGELFRYVSGYVVTLRRSVGR